MGRPSLLFLMCSNLFTAMFITICHYIAYSPPYSADKIPRQLTSPLSLVAVPGQEARHNLQSYFNHTSHSLLRLVDTSSAINILHTNCSLPSKTDNCSFVQFEAILNLADRTVCKCDDTRLSVGSRCVSQRTKEGNWEAVPSPDSEGVTVFAVTPTYVRETQKVDLTSLCYTLQHVRDLVWIVVEDAVQKTNLVANLLKRCKVRSVHLNAKTSSVYKVLKSRGVEQRNTGLAWIREHCKIPSHECQRGVLYFMDDDNKYDLRLFDQIKKTKVVSVLPVAFSGGLKYEGPVCQNGTAVRWRAQYAPERVFPMDMAGFAIHISSFLAKPDVKMGFTTEKGRKRPVKDGHLETDYLENFATRSSVECRGSSSEVFVWHVKTLKPPLPYEAKHKSDPKLEV